MQQSDGAAFAELLAFVAVAEALSFTRAGTRLGRDPTVLSRRVSALEERLGVRLLARTTRTVTLTEAGRAYLARARVASGALADAEAEASGFATGEPRGHLRLAFPPTFGRLWLAPIVAEFAAAHPQVTVETELSNRFVDLVGEGFDLAVRVGALGDSRLVARRVAERGRLLCASRSYLERAGTPRHPEDLAGHACLELRGLGLATPGRWVLDDGARRVTIPIHGPVASDDAESLVEAATTGLGIFLGADWLVGRELASGNLVRVLDRWSFADEGAIWILTPHGTTLPSKTRAFSDFLAARLAPPPWRISRRRRAG